MKNVLKLTGFLAIVALIASCADFEDHGTTASTGTVTMTKVMSVGNSITAGYQSNGMYESGQLKAYGRHIALSAGAAPSTYQTPTVAAPGLDGTIIWDGSFTATGSPDFGEVNNPTPSFNNQAYYASATGDNYNNLGVPGMIMVIPGTGGAFSDFFDVNVNNTGTDALIGPGGAFGSRNNPLFNAVLLNGARGTSIWQALKTSQPTFVTFWLGNNDVLGYATSGGTNPSAPTTSTHFSAKYTAALDSILSLASNPKVAVATIPDVTTIPYFTTANPSLAELGVATIYYIASNGDTASLATNTYTQGMVVLTATSEIGNGVTTFTGLTPSLPLANKFVLDPTEIATAVTASATFNATIKTIASNANRVGRVVVVDAAAEFAKIGAATAAGDGVYYGGQKVDARFILGGLFSYDGVHPSDLGHGIVANMFIDAINDKWGASLKQVELNSLAQLTFAKLGTEKVNVIGLDNSYFKEAARVLGAQID